MVEDATRLTYDFKRQGSYSCQLLTFEGGTWTAKKIYQQNTRQVDGREVLSGYIASSPGRHFRVLITFTRAGKRTQHWLTQEDLLCAIYVDGRRTAISEHTIRRGTFENPVDLTAPCTEEGVVLIKGLPISNVPQEQDQPFSWKPREQAYNPLTKLPKGCECVDDLSSLRLVFSTCKVKRVKRGRAAFPASDATKDANNKEDKSFEPKRLRHEELSEYIHIANMDSAEEGFDEIPDFDVQSEPFMKFRLYYKSERLLRKLGFMDEPAPRDSWNSLRKERPVQPVKAQPAIPRRLPTPEVAYKLPTPASQAKKAPIYQSAGPTYDELAARIRQRAQSSNVKQAPNKVKKPESVRQPKASTSTVAARKRKAPPVAPSAKKARTIPKAAPPARDVRPPSPPPTPEPAQAPGTARAASPAVSDTSSLPSISRIFARHPPRASTPQAAARAQVQAPRQATPEQLPRVKQEEGPSGSASRRRAAPRPSGELIDLTMDSDAEEECQKGALAAAIAAERNAANTSQAIPDTPGVAAAGIPRLVRERQAATDLLVELGIHDDSNIQALVDTGFKSRETFLNRLPRLDEEDRISILAELRSEMDKVDYGIFCGFLKRSGVEL